MIKSIALWKGYAESQKNSVLIFTAEIDPPKTPKAALHSLVQFLYDKFLDEYPIERVKIENYARCCKDTWADGKYKNPVPEVCSKCSIRFIPVKEFFYDAWLKFLDKIFDGDANDYGDPYWPNNPSNWTVFGYKFGTPKSQILEIPVNGPEILSIVLINIHPELMDIWFDDTGEFKDLMEEDHWLQEEYKSLIKNGKSVA